MAGAAVYSETVRSGARKGWETDDRRGEDPYRRSGLWLQVAHRLDIE